MTNNKISKLKNIIQVYTNTETITNNKLAVEWLAKSYVDLLTKLNNEEISLKEFEIQYIELLEQAKEMEKQQMIEFASWLAKSEWMSIWVVDKWMWECQKENSNTNYKTDKELFDIYFNETYGGGEQ